MLKAIFMGFWSIQQAKFCSTVGTAHGWAAFFLALFFCCLANQLIVGWYHHGK